MRNTEPGVIKGCTQPPRGYPGRVAGDAGCGVLRGHVIRHCATERHRVLPGRFVASVAIRIRRSEAVRRRTHVA
jgi:hypothetical protein